jgi:hypothetical protein
VSGLADNTYTVAVTSDTGNVFKISRNASSQTALTCTTAGNAGCPTGGNWG